MVYSLSQRTSSSDCLAERVSQRPPLRSGFSFRTAPHRFRPVRDAVFLRGSTSLAVGLFLAALVLLVPVAADAGPRGSLAPFDQAQQTLRQGACGVFSIKPRVHLEPVTAIELAGGNGRQALPSGAYRSGGGVFKSLGVHTSVSRSVPELWRMRMPLDTRLFALDVSYELVGANGRSSCLGSLEEKGSEIKVIIDKIPSRIIGREAHSMVIEGGMVIHMKMDTVRSAGKYSGTLTVVVNQF